MTTVLLFRITGTVSIHNPKRRCVLHGLKVHSSSPDLLTKRGPLREISYFIFQSQRRRAHLKSERGSRHKSVDKFHHTLYMTYRCTISYPEGYFGRDQLLDDSMSLSPRQQRSDPPLKFLPDSIFENIVHHLSGLG